MEETLPESQEKETQSKGLLPGIFSPDGRTSAESETSPEERTSAESSGEGTAAEEQGGSTKSEETDPGEPLSLIHIFAIDGRLPVNRGSFYLIGNSFGISYQIKRTLRYGCTGSAP